MLTEKTIWITSEIFLYWLKHFIKFAKPTQEGKVLLILDEHKSHTQSFDALELASKKGVIMLSLRPHTNHKLQPLNLTFFRPLKTYYYQNIEHEQWLKAHPGRAVTVFQVSQIFGLAYGKAATINAAVKDFKKAGICPIDRSVFEEHEFTPVEVTDRPDSSTSQILTDDIVLSTCFVSTKKPGTFNNMPALCLVYVCIMKKTILLILQFLIILWSKYRYRRGECCNWQKNFNTHSTSSKSD